MHFIYHLDVLQILLFLKVANAEKVFPSAIEFIWTYQFLAEENSG